MMEGTVFQGLFIQPRKEGQTIEDDGPSSLYAIENINSPGMSNALEEMKSFHTSGVSCMAQLTTSLGSLVRTT